MSHYSPGKWYMVARRPGRQLFIVFCFGGDSRNGKYGISTAGEAHSALMLPARITLLHLSVSSAMSLPKSAGEPASAVPPKSARCALILGSARAALISLLSLSMISAGVFLGTARPVTKLAS